MPTTDLIITDSTKLQVLALSLQTLMMCLQNSAQAGRIGGDKCAAQALIHDFDDLLTSCRTMTDVLAQIIAENPEGDPRRQ